MKFVPNKVSRTVARTILKTQKHSPGLLYGAGVVTFGATVVLAAAATLKVEDVLYKSRQDQANVKYASGSSRDERIVLAHIYINTALDLGKLYAPAVICGGTSLICFTKSYQILNKRNAALTLAYTGLDKAFREYRQRVREHLDEDQEWAIYHNVTEVELVEDTKKGPKKVVATRHGDRSLSPYARLYGPENAGWQASPEFRFLWLKGKQNWMNKQLERKGHVMLNDVYDELEMERTPEGTQVGWLSEGTGDGFIDFGFEDPARADTFLDFVLGKEGSIWLDFNVDGVIWREI